MIPLTGMIHGVRFTKYTVAKLKRNMVWSQLKAQRRETGNFVELTGNERISIWSNYIG